MCKCACKGWALRSGRGEERRRKSHNTHILDGAVHLEHVLQVLPAALKGDVVDLDTEEVGHVRGASAGGLGLANLCRGGIGALWGGSTLGRGPATTLHGDRLGLLLLLLLSLLVVNLHRLVRVRLLRLV